ncbi:hypothetical protein [Streptomyces sp. NPDC052496]|uniref:hypothetical protein n=1 Tax=Streptomyces sp. NPDC052496 TaxID=3154951 RepID=UPI0034287B38
MCHSDPAVRQHERRNAEHTLLGLAALARHSGQRPVSAETGAITERIGDSLICTRLVGKLLATRSAQCGCGSAGTPGCRAA